MTPQEHIIQALNDFIIKFPQTRVRYEYDPLSDVHFIEVIPNKVYHLDKDYIDWENHMYDEFVSSHPDQNICFISDDAVIRLKNVQLELIGTFFDISYSTNRTEILVDESSIKVTGLIKSSTVLSFTSNPCSLPTNDCDLTVVLNNIENCPLAA
ncbi:MAG: hypothetical protein ABFC18_00445 [Rikenellaceae bacterium]|jgi:hypothetical protein|nr:hypothetical protein [Bacteroidales bacterium]